MRQLRSFIEESSMNPPEKMKYLITYRDGTTAIRMAVSTYDIRAKDKSKKILKVRRISIDK
jgi:hypothetical protein